MRQRSRPVFLGAASNRVTWSWDQADVDAVESTIFDITFFAQFVVEFFTTGQPPASDLKTTSSFLSTLNSNPTNTIPSTAKTFFIYGDEDDMTHWRILQTSALNEVEDGNWAGFFEDVADVYDVAFAVAGAGAIASIIACVENYDPAVCEGILELFVIASSAYVLARGGRWHRAHLEPVSNVDFHLGAGGKLHPCGGGKPPRRANTRSYA